MLGPKIDARLNLLERKLADLTHRLERVESASVKAMRAEAFGDTDFLRRIAAREECDCGAWPGAPHHATCRGYVPPVDTSAAPVAKNAGVDATLTPKPRRGRPPKAKNA